MDGLFDQLPGLTRELINYGPYALLALFLLVIAPKHTKRFIECQDADKAKRNLLCGIAIGNWAVVFVMCFYIYTNWSPVSAYQGSLGVHNEESSFFTIDANSYIATKTVADDAKMEWVFAFITDSGVVKQDDRFRFIHEFRGASKSYSIPASSLKQGKVYISANITDPGQLMFDDDHDSQTDSVLLKPVAINETPRNQGQGGFMAAYAAPAPTNNAAIIRQLSSPNRHFQAVGKRKLKSKSLPELQLMLKTPNLNAQARTHIEARAQVLAGIQ